MFPRKEAERALALGATATGFAMKPDGPQRSDERIGAAHGKACDDPSEDVA